ncbi:uncharacterized protein METZ01_LOCUS365846, partial [marine metagenome]
INYHVNGAGGGVMGIESDISFIEVRVASNNSNTFGGGLFLYECNIEFNSVIIENNEFTFLAGGLFLWNTSILMDQSIVRENASGHGAGMMLKDCEFDIINSEISNNIGYFGAGGAELENSSGTFEKVLIADNTADASTGGGIRAINSDILLNHVTITNNTSHKKAGIGAESSEIIILNSIVRGNNANDPDGFPEDFYISGLDDSEAVIDFSNIGFDWEGENNIDQDPLFVDPGLGDYSLTSMSECIDSGTDYYEINGDIIIGIEPIEYNGVGPDMGAYEYDGISLDFITAIIASDDLGSDPFVFTIGT